MTRVHASRPQPGRAVRTSAHSEHTHAAHATCDGSFPKKFLYVYRWRLAVHGPERIGNESRHISNLNVLWAQVPDMAAIPNARDLTGLYVSAAWDLASAIPSEHPKGTCALQSRIWCTALDRAGTRLAGRGACFNQGLHQTATVILI